MAFRMATKEDIMNPAYNYLVPGIGAVPINQLPVTQKKLMNSMQGTPSKQDPNNPSLFYQDDIKYDPNNYQGLGYYVDITPGISDEQKRKNIDHVIEFDANRGALPPIPSSMVGSRNILDLLQQTESPDYSFLLNQESQGAGPQGYLAGNPATTPSATPETNLLNQAVRFSDAYKPFAESSDKAFKEYTDLLGGQTDADRATQAAEAELLAQVLGQIDADEQAALATTKLDFLDRGLAGPGASSDIEQNALAQIRSGAGKTKATERSKLAIAQLQRQREREKALQTAYGDRYKTQAAIGAQGAGADVSSLNSLLGTQYTTEAQRGENAANRALQASEGAAGRALQASEGAAGRSLQGKLKFADIVSTGQEKMLDRVFQKLLTDQQLDQQERQFYDKLDYDIQSDMENRILQDRLNQRQYDSGDFWSNAGGSLLSGIIGGFGGPIGSALSGVAINALTPKPKKQTIVPTAGVNKIPEGY